MSTGRKSQVEKFSARIGKVKMDEQVIREAEAKRAQEVANEETEEVKAMRVWAKIWGNSIENTMKNAIAPVLKEMVREVVREEMTFMMKSFSEAQSSFSPDFLREELRSEVRSALQQSAMELVIFEDETEELIEESAPVVEEVILSSHADREYQSPRYSQPRVMSCSHCKQEGHNKRTCPELKVLV